MVWYFGTRRVLDNAGAGTTWQGHFPGSSQRLKYLRFSLIVAWPSCCRCFLMDPFSVAASIGTIVALITKSISTLNSLRIQCQNAQLRLELLAGQLETVQAALRQVNLFVTDCLLLSDQHHQLVADLARAVGYCKLLVQHIDHQISRIHTPGCDLKLENRVLLVLEDKAIEEYLTRLDHQLSALNVCLVAFNWYALLAYLPISLTFLVEIHGNRRNCSPNQRAAQSLSKQQMMQTLLFRWISLPCQASIDEHQ